MRFLYRCFSKGSSSPLRRVYLSFEAFLGGKGINTAWPNQYFLQSLHRTSLFFSWPCHSLNRANPGSVVGRDLPSFLTLEVLSRRSPMFLAATPISSFLLPASPSPKSGNVSQHHRTMRWLPCASSHTHQRLRGEHPRSPPLRFTSICSHKFRPSPRLFARLIFPPDAQAFFAVSSFNVCLFNHFPYIPLFRGI